MKPLKTKWKYSVTVVVGIALAIALWWAWPHLSALQRERMAKEHFFDEPYFVAYMYGGHLVVRLPRPSPEWTYYLFSRKAKLDVYDIYEGGPLIAYTTSEQQGVEWRHFVEVESVARDKVVRRHYLRCKSLAFSGDGSRLALVG